MRGTGVHFDFRGQVCLGKRLLEDGLVAGRARVVIFRDGNEELRLGFRSLKVRAVWRGTRASPSPLTLIPTCFHTCRRQQRPKWKPSCLTSRRRSPPRAKRNEPESKKQSVSKRERYLQCKPRA